MKIFSKSPTGGITCSEENAQGVWFPHNWPLYQKKALTPAIRIEEPFTVMTDEGPLTREDGGYLAVDARGYPYPIAAEEFEIIYEKVDRDG